MARGVPPYPAFTANPCEEPLKGSMASHTKGGMRRARDIEGDKQDLRRRVLSQSSSHFISSQSASVNLVISSPIRRSQ